MLIQKRLSKAFLLSAGISVLCFAPWFSLLAHHATKSNCFWAPSLTLLDHVGAFLTVIALAFYNESTQIACTPFWQTLGIWMLVLSAFLLVALRAPARVSTFVFAMFIVPAFCLLFYCLQHGLSATFQDRYWTPACVVAPLCVAGAIALGMAMNKAWARRISVLSFLVFVLLGLLSCVQFLQCKSWMHRDDGMLRLAAEINQRENPIVVCKGRTALAVVLGYLLRDDAKVWISRNLDSPPGLATGFFKVNIGKSSDYYPCEYVAHDPNLKTKD
jgi:hypothetical protein